MVAFPSYPHNANVQVRQYKIKKVREYVAKEPLGVKSRQHLEEDKTCRSLSASQKKLDRVCVCVKKKIYLKRIKWNGFIYMYSYVWRNSKLKKEKRSKKMPVEKSKETQWSQRWRIFFHAQDTWYRHPHTHSI